MEFNEHQSRLWSEMIQFIVKFRNGNIRFTELVYSLEGALDAGEYKNKELVDHWYSFWTPLEIWASTKGDDVTFEDVDGSVSEMDRFLKSNPEFK